jgi:hypothetical protein
MNWSVKGKESLSRDEGMDLNCTTFARIGQAMILDLSIG